MTTRHIVQTHFDRSSATQRLRIGIGASILRMIVRSSYTLLLVPLFLRAWGPETYGHWLTLTALLAYVTLLNFGGQNYVGNMLTLDVARKDGEAYKTHLSESMSFFLVLGLLVIDGITLLMLIPGITFPGIDGPLSAPDRLILLFMGSSTILAIIHGIYMKNYQAHGLWARSNFVYTLLETGSVASRAFLLLLLVSPMFFAGAYFFLQCFIFTVMAWDMWRCVPLVRSFRFSFAAAWRGVRYLRGSLFFWLMTLAMAINNQGIILVAGEALNTAAVSLFVTHRVIANMLSYPAAIVKGPLEPELSRLAGMERIDEMRDGLLLGVRLLTLLTLALALGAFVWAPVVYPLWTGDTLAYAPLLLAVMLVQMALQAGWETAGWGILAANAHREVAVAQVANAVVTIALALWWAPQWGILGLALASLAGDVLCSLTAYPFFSARFLRMNPLRIYGAIARGWLAFVPLIALFLILRLFFDGVLWAVLATTVGLLMSYPTMVFAIGRDEARVMFRTVVKRLQLSRIQFRS